MYTMGTPVNILTALISLFVLLSTDCDAVEFTVNHFKHAKLIKKEELPEFKKSNTISVLYYFLKGKLHTWRVGVYWVSIVFCLYLFIKIQKMNKFWTSGVLVQLILSVYMKWPSQVGAYNITVVDLTRSYPLFEWCSLIVEAGSS